MRYKEKVTVQPASTSKRFFAFLIDLLILDIIVFAPLRMMWDQRIGSRIEYSPELIESLSASPAMAVSVLVMFGLMIAYFVILEFLIGQTPGKMLLKLQVIADEPGVKRPTILQCIIRSMVLIPVLPFVLLWLIDPVVMIFSKKKQRLCEILSKTRVVQLSLEVAV